MHDIYTFSITTVLIITYNYYYIIMRAQTDKFTLTATNVFVNVSHLPEEAPLELQTELLLATSDSESKVHSRLVHSQYFARL